LTKKPLISVVIPVYGCAECLILLYQRLEATIKTITEYFEIVLINDSSPDGSWSVITDLCKKDKRVKGINLSKNFGQHHAITAGMDFAKGKWIVVMDCDLQDQPEEIVNLYNKALEGYEIVYGISEFRSKKNFINQVFSKVYYNVYDILTKSKVKNTNLSFYIMSRKAKNALISLREHSRHTSALMRYIGFKIIGINVKHKEREIGKSSYSLIKKIKLAVVGIISYSSTLLRLSFYVGFFFSVISILYGSFVLFNKISHHYTLPGWASTTTLICFSTGLILSVLGIIGIYIEKIFLEVKGRPLYIVDDIIDYENEDRVND